MEEIPLRLDLYKTDEGYGIYLSDCIGGSGIEVDEKTKSKCAKEIAKHIKDYLYYLDE